MGRDSYVHWNGACYGVGRSWAGVTVRVGHHSVVVGFDVASYRRHAARRDGEPRRSTGKRSGAPSGSACRQTGKNRRRGTNPLCVGGAQEYPAISLV